MRLAVVVAVVALAASSRPGCGDGADGYRPCAGKACGESCTVCPPGDPGCAETAVLKVCHADGRCDAAAGELACSAREPAPHADCAGKRCGDACNPCGPDASCPTFMATACDAGGQCVSAIPGVCERQCDGEVCGAPCHPQSCVFGAPCFEPGYCDEAGRCAATGAVPRCGAP